jgi:hypothetical protein
MNNSSLTLIYPVILGKIKPFQNLSLIISCILLLVAFTLAWFDNKVLSNMVGYLIALSGLLLITFFLLSLPFFLFKRLEVATIANGIMSIDIDHKRTDFNTDDIKFLLNCNSELVRDDQPLTLNTFKDLSTWGNYIVIPSDCSRKNIYIQFKPDEDLFKVLPQLKIETSKSRSILMYDTTDLLKKFIWMLWGAS